MIGDEMEKKPKGDSVWTEGSGVPVPQEPEVARPTRKPVKKAGGGSIKSASSRADGIAERGKTRGTMVMCSGGMAKRK